jgi:FkbM family methyltransferase
MIERIGSIYAYLFGRPAFVLLNKALFYLGSRGLGLKNFRNDALSGERYVLKEHVPSQGAPVVFDIGANTGDWSRMVIAHSPNAQLHLFEPQPRLAATLSQAFVNARVNACGTGDVSGVLDLYDYAELGGSEHATMLPNVIEGIHFGKSSHQQVKIIRLADYCRANEIERIDFLKVDVEGYELKTLHGCGDLILDGMIAKIQFEFNEMNIASRAFMTDFFALLAPKYRLYRMLPSSLLPLDQKTCWINEQFTYQNILAIRTAQ